MSARTSRERTRLTQYVARHGPSPIMTVNTNSRVRGFARPRIVGLSASHPIKNDAGDPTTKKASWR
eukprot:31526-Pelagococcus_subviridis.AAC.7